MGARRPFRYNIDAMVARGNSIFGYGWLFHEYSDIKEAHLKLHMETGRTVELPITHGRPRDDVARVYPENHRAFYSGFVVYGGWKGHSLQGVELQCTTEDGATFSTPINVQLLDGKKGHVHTSSSSKFLIYKLLLTRFWTLFRQGNFKTLVEKTSRYLTKMPASSQNTVEEIARIWRRAGRPDTLLLIDHDLGGGANSYRKKVIEDELNRGRAVILYTYHVLLLKHVLEVFTTHGTERLSGDDSTLFSLPQSIRLSHIFYNTGVSFEQPEALPVLLTTLSKQYNIPLTLAINDYFVICPSQFLLDHKGSYCDIPDVTRCKECLPKNDQGFISLFLDRDIELWRERWGDAIKKASKIICFSRSSMNLLLKAYPVHGVQEKASIEPHKVRPPHRLPSIDVGRNLHIGIVGHINVHKGARIVKALADHIKKRELPVKITIFGTIEGVCEPDVVRLLGAYDLRELPDLIEDSGANLFFMPSICPETFSYVVHELIHMKLPLACFDLGAQAERVATYERGLVLPIDITAREIIKRLQDFHQRLKDRLGHQ